MTAKQPATPAIWIDPDDAPDLAEAFFQSADRYDGTTLKPPAALLAAGWRGLHYVKLIPYGINDEILPDPFHHQQRAGHSGD